MHYIEEKVKELVKKHKTRDPFELCYLENIQLFYEDFTDEVNGMYQYYRRTRNVHLNINHSAYRHYFTCAHELGHGILHKNINCYFLKQYTFLSTNKLEREANLFAAFLTIPKINSDIFHEKTLVEVAYELGVPKELLELRVSVAKSNGDFLL